MESSSIPPRLSTLGHPQRLAVFRLLMRRYPDRVPATEIARALDLKPNTLSSYLNALTQVGLIVQERMGTSLRYGIEINAVRDTLDYLVLDCCLGRPDICAFPLPQDRAPTHPKINVLFICTGNSARSIFAEAILRDMGGERFNVYSAGTHPYSELNPHAVALLEAKGHDIHPLRAKHVSDFQGEDAPHMDFVFTVCDRAANEDCPAWHGQPVHGHFSTPDPVAVDGSDAEKALAFQHAYGSLWNRITLFVARIDASMKRNDRQRIADDVARLKETNT